MSEQQSHAPSAEGIRQAAARIHAILRLTPLIRSEIRGQTVWLKDETAQPVRSFKIRGAWNRIGLLDRAERARGVVALSSGNHAQGVAWSARRLGIAATILMPRDTPAVKLDAVRALGAEILYYDRMGDNREKLAANLCAETGAILVHAFADPWIIEGQGSVGLEIASQLDRLPSRIVTPCGGGGLAAGCAIACPEAEIIPIEPFGWDDVTRSLAIGRIVGVDPDAPSTICDGIQTPSTAPINFAILHKRAAPGVTVTDSEVSKAQRFAYDRHGLVLEPSGAVGLAAALQGKVRLDGCTAIVLTGGNVDPKAFDAVLANGRKL